MKHFSIRMTRQVEQSATVEVLAENLDEACDKAIQVGKNLGNSAWETYSSDEVVIPYESDCIELS